MVRRESAELKIVENGHVLLNLWDWYAFHGNKSADLSPPYPSILPSWAFIHSKTETLKPAP